MAEPPELVIFDCDGVLVDSEWISNEILAQTLTAAGVPTTTEESLATYQGLMLDDIVLTAERQSGAELPPDFLERFLRDRAMAFQERLHPVPGVEAAVRAIRAAGIEVCVASQGQLVKTEMTLKLTGLRRLFPPEALFSAYMVPRGKPEPDLFLHAAETMGARVDRCLVVEDAVSGVRAARAAGMRVIGYAPDDDGTLLAGLGAEIIHSMEELPACVGLGAV